MFRFNWRCIRKASLKPRNHLLKDTVTLTSATIVWNNSDSLKSDIGKRLSSSTVLKGDKKTRLSSSTIQNVLRICLILLKIIVKIIILLIIILGNSS